MNERPTISQQAIAKREEATPDIIESVLLAGDLAKLSPAQRVTYYTETCRSVGLNPLTKPFDYIYLNGKLVLYANRACADQLRKINGVSLEIVSRLVDHDVLTVHVRAKMPDGRVDEDMGAVAYSDTLKGEARVNAALKAVTKAKRRATLSICGLGWLDETEVADIPASAKREFEEPEQKPKGKPMKVVQGSERAYPPPNQLPAGTPEPPAPPSGELKEEAAPPSSPSPAIPRADDGGDGPATAAESTKKNEFDDDDEPMLETAAYWDKKLEAAAANGWEALREQWGEVTPRFQETLRAALDRRHKPAAREADAKKLA